MQEATTRIVISCMAIFCALMWTAIPLAAVHEKGLQTAFFAFDNGVGRGKWTPQEQARTLKELAYAGIGYTGIENLTERLKAFDSQGLRVFSLYVPCHPGKKTTFAGRTALLTGGILHA